MKRHSLPLSPPQSWWVLAAGTLAVAPLAPYLPPWLAVAAAAALVLRGWLIAQRSPLLSRWVMVILVMAGTAGILGQYRTLFGQQAGVAMLVLFIALKLHESKARRDGLAVVLLCYFLSLTTFFYSQSMTNATLLLAAVVVTTATLASLVDDRQPPAHLLRQSAAMLAQATPFLLILFLLFPRVSGPLWGLPRDAHSALTGLSDSMTPGSISSLSQSDAIAFRVKFDGTPPPRDQLYWRGPVLTAFDGRTWDRIPARSRQQVPYDVPESGDYRHEVTLEPHNKLWLFALELPTALPPDSFITDDFQLLARTPVTQRQRYAVASHVGLSASTEETRWMLSRAKALPKTGNPRIRALAAEWRAKHADDELVLREAISHFQQLRLTYTLTPPLLGPNPVDEFLFDTKQGFCEHFAGAFVFALRAAGIPARVVTGYQGGEVNPVDGYLTVRQSDAHAWTEVWISGKGWLRIDPTAASYPLRIEQNLAAVVPAGDPLPFLMRMDLPWVRDLRFRWDAVTNAWNQWIIGYTPQRQQELLSRLGLGTPDWRWMTTVLSIACGGVVLGLTLWALRQRRRKDPVVALWRKATARLAQRGLGPRAWEGPQAYAVRVAAARPEISAAIRDIAGSYARLRYGNADESQLAALRAQVAAFKP